MTPKHNKKLDFKGEMQFEIKKGLFLNAKNYDNFMKMYNLALERKKPDFPFRSDEGELFKVETEFVSFVLKTMSNTNIKEMNKKSKEYDKRQKQADKEELRLAIKEHEEEKEEGFDEEITPVRQWRRELYKKHTKNK